MRLAGGEVIRADVVVANPDLPYVYEKLLPGGGAAYEAEAARLASMDYSAAVLAFNWALKAPLPRLPGFRHVQSQSTDGTDP